jgi:hypothetical protein
MHDPPTPEHTLPPPPQLASVQHVPFAMQVPLHSLVPPGHTHDPPAPVQMWPPPQLAFEQHVPLGMQLPLQS